MRRGGPSQKARKASGLLRSFPSFPRRRKKTSQKARGLLGSPFGEVIASGIYVAALWRKLDHELNGDVDYICGVCWEKAEWKLAVRAGDTLRATSEVVEKRLSSSDPTRGVITYICRLEKPCGTTVFEFRSIALINCRKDN